MNLFPPYIGLVAAFISATVALADPPPPPTTLNGDFEVWKSPGSDPRLVIMDNGEMPVDWLARVKTKDPITDETPKPVIARDSSVKHSGNYSVRFTSPAGAVATFFTSPNTTTPAPIAIEPGKLYKLTGWVKTDGLQPDEHGQFIRAIALIGEGGDFFGGHNNNRYQTLKLDIPGTTDWTQFEFLIEPTGNEVRLFLSFDIVGTGGSLWLDDIQLTAE